MSILEPCEQGGGFVETRTALQIQHKSQNLQKLESDRVRRCAGPSIPANSRQSSKLASLGTSQRQSYSFAITTKEPELADHEKLKSRKLRRIFRRPQRQAKVKFREPWLIAQSDFQSRRKWHKEPEPATLGENGAKIIAKVDIETCRGSQADASRESLL